MIKNDINNLTENLNDKLNGIYRGVIEDNQSDPLKLGRCKIRIFGIHSPNKVKTDYDGIPTEELPWAEPVMGLFEGSMSGFGSWIVPLQGSHVFVFFEGGHILKPRYFATVPGIPETQEHGLEENQGFSDPDKTYPIEESTKPHQPNGLEESDFHRLSKGETSNTIVESKNEARETNISSALGESSWDEPESYYESEYPKNKVFSTHSGITIEIDDTEEKERIHIYHPSNTFIEIDHEGNVVIKNNKDKFLITENDKKEHIKRDYNINITRDYIKKIDNDDLEEVGNDKILYVKGKLYISADGGIDIWGGQNINMDAPEIHLNDGIASKKDSR
jgi:hypothetical protein